MKRFLSVFAVAALLTGFASCSNDDEPKNPPTPVDKEEVIADLFGTDVPEFVSGDQTDAISVEPNSSVAIGTFNAVYPWSVDFALETLSVSAKAIISRAEAEGYKFKLSENPNDMEGSDKLSGKADGKSHTIYLITPAAPAEGNANATVNLTVNTSSNSSETFTLYKAFVGQEDLTFFVETAVYDGVDNFVYNDDPESTDMFVYQPIDYDIELYYVGSFYQNHVKITSDFECEVKDVPSWLKVVNESYEDDVYKFDLRAVTTKIDNPEGEIVFISKDASQNITLTYNVSIPNYGQVSTLVPQEMYFDYQGNPVQIGTSLGRSTVYWTGVSDYTTYYFEYNYSGNVYELVDTPSWYTVKTVNDSDDDAYLQDYITTVTVDENDGFSSRKGAVIIMPFYGFDKISEDLGVTITESVFEDGLNDNALQTFYSFLLGTIEQEAQPALSITSAQAEEYAEWGAYFEKSPADSWYITGNKDLGQAGSFFDLVYTSKWNNEDEIFLTPASSLTNITFEYYDGDANPIQAYDDDEPVQGDWLQAVSLQSGIRIFMYPNYDTFVSPDYAHEGFVLVLSNGTPVVCVHCIYDENMSGGGSDTPGTGGDSDELVSFVANPDTVDGAVLMPLTPDNMSFVGVDEAEYNEALGAGTQLYILNYTTPTPTNATLNIPAGYLISYMPYGISWLSSEYADWATTGSTLNVVMSQPAAGEPEVGMIHLYKNMSSDNPAVTIYCWPYFE